MIVNLVPYTNCDKAALVKVQRKAAREFCVYRLLERFFKLFARPIMIVNLVPYTNCDKAALVKVQRKAAREFCV